MAYNSSLISKNALAVEHLAKYFIGIENNSRIKTISELENEIMAARGTIQNSMTLLKNVGAITLKPRGHLGTFLISKDLSMLLRYANISFIVGVMPLPYSKLYEGLSTGLLHTMENQLNVPVNMAYMRGANRRIEMVLNGRYDFAILSKFAAINYLNKFDDIEIITEFEPGSFLNKHVVMFNSPDKHVIEDGMRVGIDYDSIDQASLTLEVSKSLNVKLVEVSYNQLVEKLLSNEIDAAIWNDDEQSRKTPAITTRDLKLDNNYNTIAVIVIDKGRQDLKQLLMTLINIDEVQQIQQQVVNNERIPSY